MAKVYQMVQMGSSRRRGRCDCLGPAGKLLSSDGLPNSADSVHRAKRKPRDYRFILPAWDFKPRKWARFSLFDRSGTRNGPCKTAKSHWTSLSACP